MSGADSEPQFNYLKLKMFLWKTVLQLWGKKSSTKLRENTHMSNKILILIQWKNQESFNPNLKLYKDPKASCYSARSMLIHTHGWELSNSWRTQHQILWRVIPSQHSSQILHIFKVSSQITQTSFTCTSEVIMY